MVIVLNMAIGTGRATSLVYGCQGDPANLVANIRMLCTVYREDQNENVVFRCRMQLLIHVINMEVFQVADQRCVVEKMPARRYNHSDVRRLVSTFQRVRERVVTSTIFCIITSDHESIIIFLATTLTTLTLRM